MNLLQVFIADCNAQDRASEISTEAAEFNGRLIYGTFGDATTIPIMTATGYTDQIATMFKVERSQFGQDIPADGGSLKRVLTARNYFVNMIDYTNPVVWTFILTDRTV